MNTMNIPGFNAEASLYKTSKSYYLIGVANAVIGSEGVLLQQRTRQGGLGSCIAGCDPNTPDFGFGCTQKCLEDFGSGGGINGGGNGLPPAERCAYFPDRNSSTGWRERCCTTVPGFGTQCNSLDECPAPGCGPIAGLPGCTCTCAPDCHRTCMQQCRRYVRGLFGWREQISPQPCQPISPFPIPGPITA